MAVRAANVALGDLDLQRRERAAAGRQLHHASPLDRSRTVVEVQRDERSAAAVEAARAIEMAESVKEVAGATGSLRLEVSSPVGHGAHPTCASRGPVAMAVHADDLATLGLGDDSIEPGAAADEVADVRALAVDVVELEDDEVRLAAVTTVVLGQVPADPGLGDLAPTPGAPRDLFAMRGAAGAGVCAEARAAPALEPPRRPPEALFGEMRRAARATTDPTGGPDDEATCGDGRRPRSRRVRGRRCLDVAGPQAHRRLRHAGRSCDRPDAVSGSPELARFLADLRLRHGNTCSQGAWTDTPTGSRTPAARMKISCANRYTMGASLRDLRGVS